MSATTDAAKVIGMRMANDLISFAKLNNLVITIKLEPLKPLAMGNHEMVAEVTEKKPY